LSSIGDDDGDANADAINRKKHNNFKATIDRTNYKHLRRLKIKSTEEKIELNNDENRKNAFKDPCEFRFNGENC